MVQLQVVTGTRAEYGLLRPVLAKLGQSAVIHTELVVTGSHLSEAFGRTVAEVEADGYPIAARLDILSPPVAEGRLGTARRTALALELFLNHFAQNPPAAVLLLGDRYEILAASEAAALLDIPLAHISGGEVTRGADDDWFRHCVTKMAKLHFPSCELHRHRIIRMGEAPDRVFNVGGLGDENIRNMQLLGREELARALDLPLDKTPYALVTMHPETASAMPVERQGQVVLEAVEQHPELFYLFTKANADAGGAKINQYVEEFCQNNPNAALASSLGTQRYLSAMKHAALVLGNSSSGVVETPSLGTPAVNIGQRQAGRMLCANVIGCEMETEAVAKAMAVALSPAFKAKAAGARSPYNGGDTSGKIVAILEKTLASGTLTGPKTFYDGDK